MRYGEHERELHGGEPATTNNRMELTAVIEGLDALRRGCEVELYTDSTYVMKGASEWLEGWKRRGWRGANRKPVKNVDLWQRLDASMRRHRIHWHWVRGHDGNPGNERADELANLGVDKQEAL